MNPEVTVRPRLVVANVDDAVAYYEKILGAVPGPRYAEPTGHVVHAEVRIGNNELSLTQARPEWGMHAPAELDGSPVLLTLTVTNASAVGEAMIAGGAMAIIPIKDRTYGKREGRIRDPFGHLWTVSQDLADACEPT